MKTLIKPMKERLKCTNCKKVVYARAKNRCQCSIWQVGKKRV